MIVNVEDIISHRYVIEIDDDEHELLVKALGLAATYSNDSLCDLILELRGILMQVDE